MLPRTVTQFLVEVSWEERIMYGVMSRTTSGLITKHMARALHMEAFMQYKG